MRSCELHAIAIQDTRVDGGGLSGSLLRARREGVFIVAVNCTDAGGTCFCVSMDTGPRAESGYDLALTEVIEDERHYFVCEAGSERGAEVIAELPHSEAGPAEIGAAEAGVARAAANQGREMDTAGIKELLYDNLRAPALGRGRRALPDLRQLHDGLPDLLLHDGRGHDRPRRRDGRAHPRVGLLLHDGLLLRPRRQRALLARSRATASG